MTHSCSIITPDVNTIKRRIIRMSNCSKIRCKTKNKMLKFAESSSLSRSRKYGEEETRRFQCNWTVFTLQGLPYPSVVQSKRDKANFRRACKKFSLENDQLMKDVRKVIISKDRQREIIRDVHTMQMCWWLKKGKHFLWGIL